MPGTITPGFAPDLDRTRDAIASSTLSHGLKVLGDRWTTAVLLGAFTGVQKFEDWQSQLGIPRSTLTDRLKKLVALDMLRQRVYQQHPPRSAYHLTQAGLKLYDQVLMIWMWEKRWGSRKSALPARLTHTSCGHQFVQRGDRAQHRVGGQVFLAPVVVVDAGLEQADTARHPLEGGALDAVLVELLRRSDQDRFTLFLVLVGRGAGLGLARAAQASTRVDHGVAAGCTTTGMTVQQGQCTVKPDQ